MTKEELRRRRQLARAAAVGQVLPVQDLPNVPTRTMECDGVEFKRYKSLAVAGRACVCWRLPIINPVGLPATIWFVITNLVDLTSFIVALSVAFNTRSTLTQATWLSISDIVGSFVYLFDLILGFLMGFVVRWDTRAVVVRDWRECARFYLWRSTFWADLLATLPSLVQMVVLWVEPGANSLRIAYVLRLLRLIRVVRLLKRLSPGHNSGHMKVMMLLFSSRSLMLVNAFFSLAVLVNLLGCIWWHIATNEGLENSWVANLSGKDYNLFEASDAQRWVVSCYFALTTMVTIGYGDITPVTIQETGVTMIFQIVGVAFFGYLLNVATNVLAASGQKAKRAEEVKQKLQDVEDVVQQLHLSKSLQRRIRSHYAFNWCPEAEEDERYQLFRELPPQLQHELVRQRQTRAVTELGLFPADLPRADLRAATDILASASVPVKLRLGQLLEKVEAQVAPGDVLIDLSAPHCFILDEGEMQAVQAGHSAIVRRHSLGGRVDFSGPAMIGLSALFSVAASEDVAIEEGAASHQLGRMGSRASVEIGPAWGQRAVALTECHLWLVECRQLYYEMREKQPAVLLHMLRLMLRSLAGEDRMSDAMCSATGNTTAVDEAATGAEDGLPEEEQQAERETPDAQPEFDGLKGSVVARLRQVEVELQAAVEEQQRRRQEAERLAAASSHRHSHGLKHRSAQGGQANGGAEVEELTCVAVAPAVSGWRGWAVDLLHLG